MDTGASTGSRPGDPEGGSESGDDPEGGSESGDYRPDSESGQGAVSRPVARGVAAVEGAVEGLSEGVERHGLAAATHRAIDQVDRLAASTHLRRDSTRPSPLARKLHEATGRATAKVHGAQDYLHEKVDDAKRKVAAAQESGRRAIRAPAAVSRDAAQAARSYAKGWSTSLALYGVLAVFGGFALVLLTLAGIAFLTPLLGATGALLAFGVLYTAMAAVCWTLARSAQRHAAGEARRHLSQAQATLHAVGEPVREAFGAGRPYRRVGPIRGAVPAAGDAEAARAAQDSYPLTQSNRM